MTERYKITKQEVLQALLTEPLNPGTFFEAPYATDIKGCKVCAVGAILRNIKAYYFDEKDAIFACEKAYTIGQYPATNNFLSLLSIEFEEAGEYLLYGYEHEFAEQELWDILRAHIYGVALAECPEVLTVEVPLRRIEREKIKRQAMRWAS